MKPNMKSEVGTFLTGAKFTVQSQTPFAHVQHITRCRLPKKYVMIPQTNGDRISIRSANQRIRPGTTPFAKTCSS
ncbi:hypothetical protein EUGRSUZ_H00122 [Eucalyptus grandis]|uniref:Uncharacterized protein n=2 Tax=Eucalyptus grandis TaxID=71139 RepID=A0A059ATN5_EUCGR|nr:hypothetical protein EUGRSUZ_H00122 [Eucalyptus grandis]